MRDVYECCPSFEGKRFMLRLVVQDDCAALLKVYSDELAVPLFNSDNCHGDDFHYTTMERMHSAIDFWLFSYEKRYFVRWTIADKAKGEAIGTIELFNRQADDWFTDCGILRLDLRSDYERADEIREILDLIMPQAYELFDCAMIATKVVPSAKERIRALLQLGFAARKEKLIGHDGTQYGDYFARMKA
ncbi:MAG: GNAT family N-acetyltransferase [Clostridia bacterium]|nr:GNAT family N-acetyltransferase [Clostridia bacterium]